MLGEKEHWVGFYANKHMHLGNRTSNRAETTHSAIKTAIGNVSSGNMLTVTDKIDTWYRKMVKKKKKKKRVINCILMHNRNL